MWSLSWCHAWSMSCNVLHELRMIRALQESTLCSLAHVASDAKLAMLSTPVGWQGECNRQPVHHAGRAWLEARDQHIRCLHLMPTCDADIRFKKSNLSRPFKPYSSEQGKQVGFKVFIGKRRGHRWSSSCAFRSHPGVIPRCSLHVPDASRDPAAATRSVSDLRHGAGSHNYHRGRR